jgi:hypothetical protein
MIRSGRSATLLLGVQIRQALSRTAQAQASLPRLDAAPARPGAPASINPRVAHLLMVRPWAG